jgi:hypothetical protein
MRRPLAEARERRPSRLTGDRDCHYGKEPRVSPNARIRHLPLAPRRAPALGLICRMPAHLGLRRLYRGGEISHRARRRRLRAHHLHAGGTGRAWQRPAGARQRLLRPGIQRALRAARDGPARRIRDDGHCARPSSPTKNGGMATAPKPKGAPAPAATAARQKAPTRSRALQVTARLSVEEKRDLDEVVKRWEEQAAAQGFSGSGFADWLRSIIRREKRAAR